MNEYPPENEIDKIVVRFHIIQSGFNRYLTEGVVTWTKEGFIKLLQGDMELDDPRLQLILRYWHRIGFIQLIGKDDVYLQVLKQLITYDPLQKTT